MTRQRRPPGSATPREPCALPPTVSAILAICRQEREGRVHPHSFWAACLPAYNLFCSKTCTAGPGPQVRRAGSRLCSPNGTQRLHSSASPFLPPAPRCPPAPTTPSAAAAPPTHLEAPRAPYLLQPVLVPRLGRLQQLVVALLQRGSRRFRGAGYGCASAGWMTCLLAGRQTDPDSIHRSPLGQEESFVVSYPTKSP